MFLHSCLLVLYFAQKSQSDSFCDFHSLPQASNIISEEYHEHRPLDAIPECVDWRKYDIINHVKDQDVCSACWAFTVIANIESHRMIHLNKSELLSEQFLIDCSSNSQGCQTASLLKTFGTIVTEIGGVLREGDYYRYKAKKNMCYWKRPDEEKNTNENKDFKGQFKRSARYFLPLVNKTGIYENINNIPNYSRAIPVPVVGVRRVKSDEEVMKAYVYKYGPLSAAINSDAMKNYEYGGTYIDEPSDEECDPNKLDHTVLIVGYGSYVDVNKGNVVSYWIIKNSWGTNWGDYGFYYLIYGRNACGIASDVSFPYVN